MCPSELWFYDGISRTAPELQEEEVLEEDRFIPVSDEDQLFPVMVEDRFIPVSDEDQVIPA